MDNHQVLLKHFFFLRGFGFWLLLKFDQLQAFGELANDYGTLENER